MTSLNGSSRDADKFVVRLPDGMREQVNIAASSDDRSRNSLIIKAIREYLDLQQRQQVLIGSLMIASRVNAASLDADPRDLFIAANPIGAREGELVKGPVNGFVDHGMHADYLIFLAGLQTLTGGDHAGA